MRISFSLTPGTSSGSPSSSPSSSQPSSATETFFWAASAPVLPACSSGMAGVAGPVSPSSPCPSSAWKRQKVSKQRSKIGNSSCRATSVVRSAR